MLISNEIKEKLPEQPLLFLAVQALETENLEPRTHLAKIQDLALESDLALAQIEQVVHKLMAGG
jgi:hypothetical protein